MSRGALALGWMVAAALLAAGCATTAGTNGSGSWMDAALDSFGPPWVQIAHVRSTPGVPNGVERSLSCEPGDILLRSLRNDSGSLALSIAGWTPGSHVGVCVRAEDGSLQVFEAHPDCEDSAPDHHALCARTVDDWISDSTANGSVLMVTVLRPRAFTERHLRLLYRAIEGEDARAPRFKLFVAPDDARATYCSAVIEKVFRLARRPLYLADGLGFLRAANRRFQDPTFLAWVRGLPGGGKLAHYYRDQATVLGGAIAVAELEGRAIYGPGDIYRSSALELVGSAARHDIRRWQGMVDLAERLGCEREAVRRFSAGPRGALLASLRRCDGAPVEFIALVTHGQRRPLHRLYEAYAELDASWHLLVELLSPVLTPGTPVASAEVGR